MATAIRGSSVRSSIRSIPASPAVSILNEPAPEFVVSPARSTPGSPVLIGSPTPLPIGSPLASTIGSPVVEPGRVLVETVTVEADTGVSGTCCLVTWRTLVLLIFCASVPMLTIGIIYARDCPHFPFCPIYLLVGGTIGVLQFLYAAQDCVYQSSEPPRKSGMSDVRYKFAAFLFILFISWTFFGSIPFFAMKGIQWTDRQASHFCDNTIYHFTFYLSAVLDVIYFTAFFSTLFGFVLYAPTKREHERAPTAET